MKMKLANVILDYNLYPRGSVNKTQVARLIEAMDAGVELPPIVICKDSKRCVDGFHRHTAYRRHSGDDVMIDVIAKKYKTDAELFADSMRYNAQHGEPLTPYDRTHCLIRAESLGITREQVASALGITIDKIGKLHTQRVGQLKTNGRARPFALKGSIRHMQGKPLTALQAETNAHLSGMPAQFHALQLIMLIDSDLLDVANEKLMESLQKLYGKLAGVVEG